MLDPLPQDLEAEANLVGAVVVGGADVMNSVADLIPNHPNLFMDKQLGIAFGALRAVHDRAEPIDYVAVRAELIRTGTYGEFGGDDAMRELANRAGAPANAAFYAKVVAEKHRLRQIHVELRRLASKALACDAESASLCGEASDSILNLSGSIRTGSFMNAADGLRGLAERIAEGRDEFAIDTGIGVLDSCLGGLHAGDFVVLAARPSVGKTALALQIAIQVAEAQEIPVGFFSMEMPIRAIVARCITAATGIPHAKLMRPSTLRDLERQAVDELAGRWGRLWIDDRTGLTATDVLASARIMVRKHGCGLLILDYLGRMHDPASDKRGLTEGTTNLSNRMKDIARQLDVPFLVLSQLSRDSDKQNRKPKLSDLRQSGAIEQDADSVIMLHCGLNDAERKATEVYEVTLSVAKNRNGPLGSWPMMFDPKTMTFTNQQAEQAEAAAIAHYRNPWSDNDD